MCIYQTARRFSDSAGFASRARCRRGTGFPFLRRVDGSFDDGVTARKRSERLLSTPIVENGASEKGIRPHRPTEATLGPIVRAAFWNIERGLNFEFIQAGLGGPERFQQELDRAEEPAGKLAAATPQLRKVEDADIVVVNEVDLGMRRTEYRHV